MEKNNCEKLHFFNMFKSFENWVKENIDDIVFLCVGNSEVWYDSFGPIVGSLLTNKFNIPYYVYGNMKKDIRQSNLNLYIDWIKSKHMKSKILLFDSALTKNSYTDKLIFKHGSTKCAFYDKNSKEVGDFSVLCPISEDETKCSFKSIVERSLLVAEFIDQIYIKCK